MRFCKAIALITLNTSTDKQQFSDRHGRKIHGGIQKIEHDRPQHYDLEDSNVLIVLEDGTNLTDWSEVKDRKDIIYISEDLSGVSDLSHRYEGLESLKGIVAFGVGDNVKSMEYMFNKCYDLKDISSLKDWDVSGVTNMKAMFWACSGLVDLSALAGWDVSGVTDMWAMFKCDEHDQ